MGTDGSIGIGADGRRQGRGGGGVRAVDAQRSVVTTWRGAATRSGISEHCCQGALEEQMGVERNLKQINMQASIDHHWPAHFTNTTGLFALPSPELDREPMICVARPM